jgi:hypothetical protein
MNDTPFKFEAGPYASAQPALLRMRFTHLLLYQHLLRNASFTRKFAGFRGDLRPRTGLFPLFSAPERLPHPVEHHLIGIIAVIGKDVDAPALVMLQNGGAAGGAGVDTAVTGIWYSAYDSAVLDISANGTGTIIFEGTTYNAQFSTQAGVFTAVSNGYGFHGAYTVKNDTLSVAIPYEENTYTAIFTKEAITLPEELKGTHVYQLEEKAYELIIEDGNTVCKGLPFPPSDDYEEVEVIITHEFPPEGETPEKPTGTFVISPAPPPHIFVEKQPEGSSSANAPSGDTTPATKPANTPAGSTAPATNPTEPNKPAFLPDTVELEDGKVTVTKNGKTIPTTKGGGSIIGTWTSQKQKGHAYIFGHSSDMDYTVTFTFNVDGTGTCTALIFTGTMKWSLDGHRLDLTVSMLGDTDSGTGYVTIIGDVMYLVNQKGERYALTRTA